MVEHRRSKIVAVVWLPTLYEIERLLHYWSGTNRQRKTVNGVEFPEENCFAVGVRSIRCTSYCQTNSNSVYCSNEKDGIPANLLSVLDVAVEIPQLGVVRSLNVHVSGALFVWEYARQHNFSSWGGDFIRLDFVMRASSTPDFIFLTFHLNKKRYFW